VAGAGAAQALTGGAGERGATNASAQLRAAGLKVAEEAAHAPIHLRAAGGGGSHPRSK